MPRPWFQSTVHHWKEGMFPGKMADSRSETENVQGEPGTSYVRKQRKFAENVSTVQKEKQQAWRAKYGTIWEF